MTPIRCTQNPSMGEEWRRDWHPERYRARGSESKVLVVGGGPAGMEAAMALGKRGYEVTLAEATRELGGRVLHEARLPGLAAWIRVVDYRRTQLGKLANVEIALESEVSADEVREYGFDRVAVATGARWRADGIGRHHRRPIPIDLVDVLTPDDLFAGARPAGDRVVLYDDDHYYLGGALAELLAREGKRVTLVTPAALVSEWTVNTMEQPRIHRRLVEAGVEVLTAHDLAGAGGGEARLVDTFTRRERAIPLESLVLVTARLPNAELARELGVTAVGDALAPGTIASAVWDGRRYAEELDTPARGDDLPYRREVVKLA
jgi:dimethylamine/trimethylamine dehydrogenase